MKYVEDKNPASNMVMKGIIIDRNDIDLDIKIKQLERIVSYLDAISTTIPHNDFMLKSINNLNGIIALLKGFYSADIIKKGE